MSQDTPKQTNYLIWFFLRVSTAFSLLLPVDCGKIKGGAGGVANVGKAIGRSGVGGKKGIGKAAKTAAVVVGSGAAGYIAYKGIKHAVKHRHGKIMINEKRAF